jgi:hypothetical protein
MYRVDAYLLVVQIEPIEVGDQVGAPAHRVGRLIDGEVEGAESRC